MFKNTFSKYDFAKQKCFNFPLFIELNKQKKAAYIANSITDSLRCGSFIVYDP